MAGRRRWRALIALLSTLIPASTAVAITSTWLGGFGTSWCTAENWGHDVIGCSEYPNSGNCAGEFDVVIPSGTVTLGCDSIAIQHLTSGGTIEGNGPLYVGARFYWTGGALAGTGTIQGDGGVELQGTGQKTLDGERLLVVGGTTPSNWYDGNIIAGSAPNATLRIDGGATLIASADGRKLGHGFGQVINFENQGLFVVALSDPTQVLEIDANPMSGSGVVDVQQGILRLRGFGTHTGTWQGAGTLQVHGTTHVLGSGAQVTSSRVEIVSDISSSGALEIQAGADYQAVHTELGNGTLTITGPGTVAVTETATQSGVLGGDGELRATGLFTWTGGTMGGTGITRALGGLSIDGAGEKRLDGERLLVVGGTTPSNWYDGNIIASSAPNATLRIDGGATLIASAAGRKLGHGTGQVINFESQGLFVVDLPTSADVLRFDAVFTNEGVIEAQSGILRFEGGSFTQQSGSLELSGGSVEATIPLNVQGGSLTGVGAIDGNVNLGGVVSPGSSAGALTIDGNLVMGSSASYLSEIEAPVAYDQVTVTGSAQLDGELVLELPNGVGSLQPTDSFQILDAGSVSGAFSNAPDGSRVFTSEGHSFEVAYGATTVVLDGFRSGAPVVSLLFGGSAQGGSVSLTIAGVVISVPTLPGDTPADVASRLADAINAHPSLQQLGVFASAVGGRLLINETVVAESIEIDDPGLLLLPGDVPAIGAWGPALLYGLLMLYGARRLARRLGSAATAGPAA